MDSIKLIAYSLFAMWFNYCLGCAVLCFSDDEDERLFRWIDSNPFGQLGFFITVSLWPVVLYFWRFRNG